jgi:hypothetical protein
MLEKLATHDVETVTTLFTLADKCARAAEGRAWHSAPQTGVNRMGGSGATTPAGGKKKKKNRGHDRPQSGAPVAVAADGGQDERNKRHRQQGSDSGCALSTLMLTIAPRSAGRSRSSRSASASGTSRPLGMARHLVVGLTRRRSAMVT